MPQQIHHRMVRDAIKEDFPSVNLETLTSRFYAGYYLSVSLSGDPSSLKPDMERLRDADEVWALCFRDVRGNQWRLLGRFAFKNCFVGCLLKRRTELAGKRYAAAIEDAIFEWDKRFGGVSPLRGGHKNDYLSGVVRDVDND